MTDEEKLRFEAVFLYLEIARNRLKVKADVLPEKAGQALDVATSAHPRGAHARDAGQALDVRTSAQLTRSARCAARR